MDGRSTTDSLLAGGTGTSSRPQRRMQRAELLGRHTHDTQRGTVHIWVRDGKYLARGRLAGRAFGETLGADEKAAERRLHELLVGIENGAYQRPSDRYHQLLRTAGVPKLSLRELSDRYLAEIRKLRGKQTAVDYRSRLLPVIEFAESQQSRRRWPLAADMDRDFVVELRAFLHARRVTGNGHPNANLRTMSPRQVYNVLDCLRSMLHWAQRPEIHILPSMFVNPLTKDIVGERPRRDPLAPARLPLERRIKLVERMDAWQLVHLGMAMVLPFRPDEWTGLLISDVDFAEQILRCETRFGGRDFNKGRRSFRISFPEQLVPLLRHCGGDRPEGPLLRSRAVFTGSKKLKVEINDRDELEGLFNRVLTNAPPGTVESEQDAKVLFRTLLRQMGGITSDAMAKEFKLLVADRCRSLTIRDLRSSISTDMNQAGMSHLALRYFTGHTTTDILTSYVTLDVAQEMSKYFRYVRGLLDAIAKRTHELGLDD